MIRILLIEPSAGERTLFELCKCIQLVKKFDIVWNDIIYHYWAHLGGGTITWGRILGVHLTFDVNSHQNWRQNERRILGSFNNWRQFLSELTSISLRGPGAPWSGCRKVLFNLFNWKKTLCTRWPEMEVLQSLQAYTKTRGHRPQNCCSYVRL